MHPILAVMLCSWSVHCVSYFTQTLPTRNLPNQSPELQQPSQCCAHMEEDAEGET